MDIGHISVVFRRERSVHGLGPRELKSALQKYARRGEVEKGLWCLVELDAFARGLGDLGALARRDGVSEASARRRIDALRTNMMNRLVVMVSEEVSVHDVWLPVIARDLYQKWLATRDTAAGRRHLVTLYERIVASEKCRLVSDYKTVYNLAPHYLPDEEREALVRLHGELLRAHSPALYAVNYGCSLEGMSALDLASRAIEAARAGRDEALFWCGRLVEHRDATRGVSALWSAIEAVGFAREPVRALRFFYSAMTHRERPIYLYHALLLVVLRDRLDATPPTAELATSRDVDALYEAHASRRALVLDAFVFDRHTGVRSDDGRTTFALEGAKVENESTRFMVSGHRALYVEFKRVLDAYTARREATPVREAKKVSVTEGDTMGEGIEAIAAKTKLAVRAMDAAREAEIVALPRAQKRTSAAKKAVFVAPDAVFKGPYAPDDVKLRNNLVNTALVERFEAWLGLEERTVIPWRALWRRGDGAYYLEAENLGRGDGAGAWSVVSSKVETDVKVLPRGSFVRRVSELEAEALTTPARVWTLTLQHLYVLFLLGIGDEGSHNVVAAADGRVIGIDLEEFRSLSRAPTDALSAMFKRVSAGQRALYPTHLARVKTFTSPMSDAMRDEAIALGCEPARFAAAQRNIATFEAMRTASKSA